MYSPVASSESPIDAKAKIATIVAASKGNAVCFITFEAASLGSIPLLSRTKIPSTTTIALSTSIPRAIINAPKETRSSITPKEFIKIKVARIVTKRTLPMIKPLRNPIKTNNTKTTIATASIKFIINEEIAFSTSLA